MTGLKKTALHDSHVALGARMVDFGGWHMPVQYAGVLAEHEAVRTGAGVFDVSHMGEVEVSGTQALGFLQHLVTNDVSQLVNGQALYTPMCYENGTIVDDLLVYREDEQRFFLIINASNIEKDVAWMKKHASGFDVQVEDVSDSLSLLALQGPRAEQVLQKYTDIDLGELKRFHFVHAPVQGCSCMIARTGYTGEDGFELCMKHEDAKKIWDALVQDATPCGLGARDTLRLEAAMMLYGNDIDDASTPLEAPLKWTVKFGTGFVGEEALVKQREDGVKKKLVGFELLERGIARQEYDVMDSSGETIGTVTSGTQSPTLKKSIGLAYVPAELAKADTEILVSIREKPVKARVVKLPFYRSS